MPAQHSVHGTQPQPGGLRCPFAAAEAQVSLEEPAQPTVSQSHTQPRSTLAAARSAPALDSLQTQSFAEAASGGAEQPTSNLHNSISTPSLSLLLPFSQGTQPWNNKRPQVEGCPKLKRRDARRMDKKWTLAEVAEHRYVDDVWIAVDGRVYDITEHLVNHEGWNTAGVTTPLSILAHAGTECSAEFHQIHRAYPVAYKQLAAYYIGELDSSTTTLA